LFCLYPATPDISTLSYTTLFRSRGPPLRARVPPPAARVARLLLHLRRAAGRRPGAQACPPQSLRLGRGDARRDSGGARGRSGARSEEHTSELQSRFDLVCRLLLE